MHVCVCVSVCLYFRRDAESFAVEATDHTWMSHARGGRRGRDVRAVLRWKGEPCADGSWTSHAWGRFGTVQTPAREKVTKASNVQVSLETAPLAQREVDVGVHLSEAFVQVAFEVGGLDVPNGVTETGNSKNATSGHSPNKRRKEGKNQEKNS